MATISNAEFFRRLRQQRGTSSYSFNVDEFQGDDELSYSAYVDSVMNNRMLENEEERINKELIARSNELTQKLIDFYSLPYYKVCRYCHFENVKRGQPRGEQTVKQMSKTPEIAGGGAV